MEHHRGPGHWAQGYSADDEQGSKGTEGVRAGWSPEEEAGIHTPTPAHSLRVGPAGYGTGAWVLLFVGPCWVWVLGNRAGGDLGSPSGAALYSRQGHACLTCTLNHPVMDVGLQEVTW